MKKVVVGAIVVLVVGGIVAAVATGNKDPKPNATASSNNSTSAGQGNDAPANQPTSDTSVTIRNQAFSPSKITVKVGTTVTWTNQDSVQHDVKPDEDYGDAFEGSELLSRNQSYSFTFNKAGTYTYHCTPHPFMKGTIEVTE